jgi:hypothetical protein
VGLGVDALARVRPPARAGAVLVVAATAAAAALLAAALAGPLPLALARALADPLPAGGLVPHVRWSLAASAGWLAAAALPFLLVRRGGSSGRRAALALTVLTAANLTWSARDIHTLAPAELIRHTPAFVAPLRGERDARCGPTRPCTLAASWAAASCVGPSDGRTPPAGCWVRSIGWCRRWGPAGDCSGASTATSRAWRRR